MKKVLALTVLIIIFHTSMAQMPGGGGQRQGGQAPTGRLYGKIVDAANKGIEAVSVTLVSTRVDSVTKQPKEVIAGGMLTSKAGDFSIDNIPLFGRYKLRVTGIGYQQNEVPVAFQMPNRNGASTDASSMLGALDKDLGNIKLAIDEKQLGGVTVTATKPLLQLGIDRKIFNVDKNITTTGGTAVDVMRNVPSINVDVDGNVTLRNNAPQIFVDGRPTNLTLEQIPADAIESVEIITNPSAKFDASGGQSGILNIVMKKNRRVGYSGNVRVNADSRGRVGGGADINLRQNKVNFFVAGNYFQRKSISEGFTDRTTFRTDRTEKFFQNDSTISQGFFGFGRAGFDYFIDNRNTITLNGTLHGGQFSPTAMSDILSDTTYTGFTKSGFQQRATNSENIFRNSGLQMSFKHLFPKAGHELTADVTWNRGSNENTSNINTEFFSLPSRSFLKDSTQLQLGSGENKNLILQTDYTKPLSDNSKIEFGARASIRDVSSRNQFYKKNAENGIFFPSGNNVLYNSSDKVYAAYTTFSNRIKNFGYQLGLRVESSDYSGDLLTTKQTFNIKFPISLFPSVFISQKISDNDELQFNYSRRVNRPNFFQLLPFIDSSDLLNVSVGNPGLNPEFTNSLEASYSKLFQNRDNLLFSAYFKNTTDLITRFQTIDPTISKEGIVNTYINANRSFVTGLEVTARNKISKWWDMTSNINLFTGRIDVDGQPRADMFASYFLKLNNSFKLPKNFTFQLSGEYQSKIVSSPGGGGGRGGGGGGPFGGGGGMFGGGNTASQGFIRPNYGVDAALRFEFLKNKVAAISLNVNDIFRTRLYDAFSQSSFFEQNIQRRRDPQVFRLNFSFRFGKFDANLFKRRNTKAEGNVDTGGGNL